MKELDEQIPEEMAPEVLALAARLYSENFQARATSELIESQEEGQIPQIYIRQAYRQIMRAKGKATSRPKKLQEWQKKLLVILGCMAGLGAFWGVGLYVSLTLAEREIDAAWVQVEQQVSMRTSLIPNLVNIVRVYAKQETETIALLEQSRQKYLQASTIGEKQAAIAELSQAIERFSNWAASNPQVNSNLAFLNLQPEISDTEKRIARSQTRYKEAIAAYNRQIESFPNSLAAPLFGFHTKP